MGVYAENVEIRVIAIWDGFCEGGATSAYVKLLLSERKSNFAYSKYAMSFPKAVVGTT